MVSILGYLCFLLFGDVEGNCGNELLLCLL